MAPAAKTLRVSIVQCRGTPYEVGRAQAEVFAATRKGKAFLRRKVKLPWWFDVRTEERAFRAYAPALWEEIGGIAAGLNIPMEHAVAFFGNDGLRMPTGGCSAVMSGAVYGRNYDFWPRGYEARFALVQVRGSYASIGGTHQLTGRLDGMNEHGLSIGLHLVKARPRSPGLTSTLLVRLAVKPGFGPRSIVAEPARRVAPRFSSGTSTKEESRPFSGVMSSLVEKVSAPMMPFGLLAGGACR